MPVRMAIWQIEDGRARALSAGELTDETELEAILEADISMIGLQTDLLVIARQAPTPYAGRLDLLCIDGEGELWLIEIKKSRTPRDVVAQALDYGYWISELGRDEIVALYASYVQRLLASGQATPTPHASLEDAFADTFDSDLPDPVNQAHHLVIVASTLDEATERIVRYADRQGLPVNAVLFQIFSDEGRRYLARSWLIDPVAAEVRQTTRIGSKRGPWNGTDWAFTFGEEEDRRWEDARRYGYVSAGGGQRWITPLADLTIGARVFCNVPPRRYVGVGEVISDHPVPLDEFTVTLEDGRVVPIADADLETPNITKFQGDPDSVEHFVRVRWEKAVPLSKGIWETGLYANQRVVTRLRDERTRRVVLERLGLAAPGED